MLGVKCRGRNIHAGERVPLTTPITLVVGNSEIEVDENGVEYENAMGEEASWMNENEEGELVKEDYGAGTEDNDQSEILEF